MLIYIGDLNKAELLVALYNAAPSPCWMTNANKKPENQYELARQFLETHEKKNEYSIRNIDLGSGLKSLKINFRSAYINLSNYSENLLLFGGGGDDEVQKIINDVRQRAPHQNAPKIVDEARKKSYRADCMACSMGS